MKYEESTVLASEQINEAKEIGNRIAELRHSYGVTQAAAAAKAALSRSTAALIEKGDPGRTLGQLMRYVHAINPGITLAMVMEGRLPAVNMHRAQHTSKRVRIAKVFKPGELDF